jgi:hypothetical protein
LVCAGVGLLAGDGEGFLVGRFLVGVSLFLARFEDIEDFFISPSFVWVRYWNQGISEKSSPQG